MKQIKYIFLLSIIFFACDEINPVNDLSNKYTFFCVLKGHEAMQQAFLYNAVLDREHEDIYNALNNAFIHNAEIVISDGTISSQLQVRPYYWWPPSVYYYIYSDDSFFYGKILPNTKYDIQIKVDDEIVKGSTTTPGEFAINIPADNTIDLNKDADKEYIGSSLVYKYRLRWSESANASHYIVYYTQLYYKNASGQYYSVRGVMNTADTFVLIDISENHPDPEVEGFFPHSARLDVIAVDKNYYEYNILKRDRAGLNSGYGVFGSTTHADSCIVYFR